VTDKWQLVQILSKAVNNAAGGSLNHSGKQFPEGFQNILFHQSLKVIKQMLLKIKNI